MSDAPNERDRARPSAPERPDRIVLVGLRGAGKSTVAERLAVRLGLSLLDSDREISRLHSPPHRIIEQRGIATFREIERAVVLDLAERRSCVLALGGGAVESPEIVEALAGWTGFWLDAPDSELARRIHSDTTVRPPLTDLPPEAEIAELRERRTALYSSICPVMIPTGDRDPDTVVAAIVESLEEGYASQ